MQSADPIVELDTLRVRSSHPQFSWNQCLPIQRTAQRAAIEPQKVQLPAIDCADEALGRPHQRNRGQPSAVSGDLPQRLFVDP